MAKAIEKQIIGRSDKIDLPDLKLKDISAKIDTGAYGCAIHCHKIREVIKGRKKHLYFDLLDPSHPKYEKQVFKVSSFSRKRVKNSFGESEQRYTIKSKIKLFEKLYTVELSLTDRSEMKYPILLGRTFLEGKFIVDVEKTNLSKKYLAKTTRDKSKKPKTRVTAKPPTKKKSSSKRKSKK